MPNQYSGFSYDELRELLLRGELKHDYMTEEDYSEIIENELELPEPNIEVLDLCVKGLNQYDDYKALENIKADIKEIIKETDKKSNVKKISIMKFISITAAVIAIVLLAQIVCMALGFDLLGYIFKWNDEKVYISIDSNSSESSTDSTFYMYESIELIPDELLSYVSQYILTNFNFDMAMYRKEGENFYFNSKFKKDDDINLTIIISKSIEKMAEKDNEYLEEYEKDGVLYSIFKNIEYNRALWVKDNILYDLNVNLSIDEVKEIVNSF